MGRARYQVPSKRILAERNLVVASGHPRHRHLPYGLAQAEWSVVVGMDP